jgi:hypothetical protein
MKITIGQLREAIRRSLAGSQPDETYTEELLDDPGFKEKSVYVRDDAKEKIKAWAKDMKLSTK